MFKDEIDVRLIFAISAGAALLVVATIIGLQALYLRFDDLQQQQKVVEAPRVAVDTLLAEQEAQLSQTGVLDREKGRYAIPIDRAMRVVVDELQDAAAAKSREGGSM